MDGWDENQWRADQERMIHELLRAVPEFQQVFDEHVNFNGELLTHLLFGDLTRWVIDLYRKSQSGGHGAPQTEEILIRTLDFLEDRCTNAGEVGVQNIITVSFLENLHQAGPDYEGIKNRLGPNLRKVLAEVG
jgi:hypothetical protein